MNSEKIYFAISYLRSIALNYFELYINKPDPFQSLDFLEDWSVFVQKLFNIFGFYSLEDNKENAIVVIPFSADEKAVISWLGKIAKLLFYLTFFFFSYLDLLYKKGVWESIT